MQHEGQGRVGCSVMFTGAVGARPGPEFALSDPATHPSPEAAISTDTTRYGTARARA